MPIDPRIPMTQFQQPQQNQMFDWRTLAQLTELRDKRQERQQKLDKAARLADVVRGATTDVNGQPVVDWSKVGAAVAPLDPELGATLDTRQYQRTKLQGDIRQGALGEQKTQFEVDNQRLKNQKDLVEFMGRISDTVLREDTQASYDLGKATLEKAAPGSTADMPALWTPDTRQMVKDKAAQGKTTMDVLERQLKAQDILKNDREAQDKGAKAPDYGYGEAVNAAIYGRYGQEIPAGQRPTPPMVRQGLQDVQEGKVAVSAATGAQGAETKALGATAQKRLEALDQAGLTGQSTHVVLDEAERIIGEGVYGATPTDRAYMEAYRQGLRPKDAQASRTARLQELGNQLVLANGSLGGGVSKSDAETYARAAGNFQNAKNPQEMVESIKSMRVILNKAIDYANTTRETYERTGKMPAFEGRAPRSPYAGKPIESLSPAQRREELEWLRATP